MNPFIQIKGGTPLQGEIVASGAKNAMTKLLVASLISNKKCIFTNVPNIGDVDITAELCQELGAEISWDKEKKTIEIITKEISTSSISQKFSGANRIPILLIGSLLGRTTTEISVPAVGGDKLGTRPVNFHIKALEQLQSANLEREIVVCRELTKKFETLYRGQIKKILEELQADEVKGEFVVIISSK